MMMLRPYCLTALLLVAATAVDATNSGERSLTLPNDIPVKSRLGQRIMENAKRVDETDEQQQQQRALDDRDQFDFVGYYSIKFQGCHHVQQWNDQVDDEDDVRIKTKRLARFRLCPSDSCSNDRSTGCTSKFGDYVVDMNTFVDAYLQGVDEQKDTICANVAADCQNECGNADDDCMTTCYEAYEVSFCLDNDDDNNGNDFDVMDYSYCQEVDIPEDNNNGNRRGRRLEDEGYQYYIGPYCADQGGEIQLGLFTDDTCTTFADNGDTLFYNAMGYELPYSDNSLISSRCLSCSNGNGDGNNNNNNYETSEMCAEVYALSGKCETRMSVDYPNESSCGYIEGIKIIREDGVIRTSTTKKSKAAAVSIGLFMTLAVLLAGYVYYLRTKLGRAQINLAAATQPLA